MRKTLITTTITVALALAVSAGSGLAQDQKKPSDKAMPHSGEDAVVGCMEMMQSAGVSEEGKKAMREFMHSDRAPQAMANMMEMARRMGNGDAMAGMTRMMEMMGSMGGGGMMGGQGGAHGGGATYGHGSTPPAQQPTR